MEMSSHLSTTERRLTDDTLLIHPNFSGGYFMNAKSLTVSVDPVEVPDEGGSHLPMKLVPGTMTRFTVQLNDNVELHFLVYRDFTKPLEQHSLSKICCSRSYKGVPKGGIPHICKLPMGHEGDCECGVPAPGGFCCMSWKLPKRRRK